MLPLLLISFGFFAATLGILSWSWFGHTRLRHIAAARRHGSRTLTAATTKTAKTLANRSRREELRGVEPKTLDLIFQASTLQQWAELLKDPLERAAGQGNKDLAEKLVEAGAEIGDALHLAVRGGHLEVVTHLLEKGAPINAKETVGGYTPLHVAAQEGEPAMVLLLMVKGADKDAMDNHKWTPLYTAAEYGRTANALALLAGGADVSIRCGRVKRSVLHIAVNTGDLDILSAVIERGAEVDARDSNQATGLHLAAMWHSAEAVDLLVEKGANIEAQEAMFCCTPLHVASLRPNLAIVTALLKHGANVNAQNYVLETPLILAARLVGTQQAAEVVDVLLRSGADETILNEDGKTAADAVAEGASKEYRLAEDFEQVRNLLANAPADRAWRRRGYLVLCCAHPDRLHRAREKKSSTRAGMPRTTTHGTELHRLESGRCDKSVGGMSVHGATRREWTGAVAKVLGLQEEDIFRTIVGYL